MQFRTLIILLIALVIIVPVASYVGYNHFLPNERVVKVGDNVSVWYYGYIVIDGNPLIFDTNMANIANNNTSYPKAPDFKYHPPFTVLNDTVGSGSMIKGFDNGLVGMAKGQTGKFTISPAQGYGLENSSKIQKIMINGSTPAYQKMNYSTFEGRFNTSPAAGETIKSPTLGWNIYVISANGYYVVIENEPVQGGQYFPYNNSKGFSIIVRSISGNGLNSTIEYYASVVNGTLLPSGSYISGVSGGYYYLNSNSYLVGKTLFFYVDIVSVKS